MLEHRAVLAARSSLRGEQLEIAAIEDQAALLLQTRDPACVESALAEGLALRLPSPCSSTAGPEASVLWLAPTEWLIETPVAQAELMRVRLMELLAGLLVAVTDLTDAYVCIDLSGERAATILNSGCGLDMSPAVFPVGSVARTVIADTIVIIHRTAHAFRCRVDRSYADHFWTWLAESPSRW